MALTRPTTLPRPFAEGGEKTDLPDTSAARGRASFANGFPTETQLPVAAGGIPPHRLDLNGILNILSQYAFWSQSGGPAWWDAGLDYVIKCEVYANGAKYVALKESGPSVTGVGPKDPTQQVNQGTYWAFAVPEPDLSGLVPKTTWIGTTWPLVGGGPLTKSLNMSIDPAWINSLGAGKMDNSPGLVGYFAQGGPPPGWLKANGAAVSRAIYPGLFNVIGIAYGAGDGVNTFNVPDLRGVFPRGTDDGRGWPDPGRGLGSVQGDAARGITGSMRAVQFNNLDGAARFSGAFGTPGVVAQTTLTLSIGAGAHVVDFDSGRVVPTASENRPHNMALMACIKY